MPQGGCLQISTASYPAGSPPIKGMHSRPCAVLTVSDTGVGMDGQEWKLPPFALGPDGCLLSRETGPAVGLFLGRNPQVGDNAAFFADLLRLLHSADYGKGSIAICHVSVSRA